MDRPSNELLASPALTGNQNRGPAGRGLDDQVEHLLHPRTTADDSGETPILCLQGLLEGRVFGYELSPFHGVANDDQYLVVLERLGDVVECTELHRRDGGLHGGK